ncbi:TD and POZ domain-containing protein 3 [Trichonephila clavipes]|nr:TD and POZ domain-containing protein 3 [Trichonephila clavipes]
MANWSIRERKCFSFTWAIENFSFCWQKRDEGILSPSFIVDTIERSKWKLMLYPNGNWSKNSCPSDSISFYLRREEDSKGPTDITIFFELSFLAADGSVIMSSEILEDFFDRGKSGGSQKYWKKELLESERQKFVPHDILTVRCRMWKNFGQMIEERQCFASDSNRVERRSFVWTIPKPSFNKFSFNIKSIFDDKQVMTLILNLQHEYIHGNVQQRHEGKKNSEYVYIEDLDDDTVQRMLLYIYTATVPDLQWDTACDLYTAADKYEILSLKSKCSSFLKDNLSQGNACNLLILADEHQDQDLISAIQDYILIHRGIFNTKEWELFMKTNVQLAANLMHLKLKE